MEAEKAGLFDKGQMGQSLSAMANRGELSNWPTPNCMDAITPTRDLTQMESKGHWGKGMNTGKLSEMVNYGQAAPANPSTDGSHQGLWPTPASAGVTGGPCGLAGGSGNRASLAKMLPPQEAKDMGCGKLNPRWVEALMGLPIGWTMPSCTRPVTIEPTNCDCLETESSQPPQNEHLELF
jgi:hypothetical protein